MLLNQILPKKIVPIFEPINPLTNNLFSDTDVNMYSFSDSSEKKRLPSAPSFREETQSFYLLYSLYKFQPFLEILILPQKVQ